MIDEHRVPATPTTTGRYSYGMNGRAAAKTQNV